MRSYQRKLNCKYLFTFPLNEHLNLAEGQPLLLRRVRDLDEFPLFGALTDVVEQSCSAFEFGQVRQAQRLTGVVLFGGADCYADVLFPIRDEFELQM